MGLSAGPVERRAESGPNRDRKPLMLVISAVSASVVIGSVILAGAAVLNYEPAQQHVQVEITPRMP